MTFTGSGSRPPTSLLLRSLHSRRSVRAHSRAVPWRTIFPRHIADLVPSTPEETPVLGWEVHMTTKLRLRVSAMLPSGLGKPPETRARYGWMG